jgi:transcriptional regulator with XRE-family HTH domain
VLLHLKGLRSVGQRIRYLRLRVGFTRPELADTTGIDVKLIQKYECEKHTPRAPNLCLLCRALGGTPEQLLADLDPCFGLGAASMADVPEALRSLADCHSERATWCEIPRDHGLARPELRALIAWMDEENVELLTVMTSNAKLGLLIVHKMSAEFGREATDQTHPSAMRAEHRAAEPQHEHEGTAPVPTPRGHARRRRRGS